MTDKTIKPLGHKAYGHIPHLPGSRTGPGDHMIGDGQACICCEKARDKNDRIIVRVKVDGSNVSVANVGGQLIPLGRAGYPAISSPYTQHHLFAGWVYSHLNRFSFLEPGERLCGEWLAQAHGTRYDLFHGPFVAFDLMREPHERATQDELQERAEDFVLPFLLSDGPPRSIEWVKQEISDINPHGEVDPVEGAVWRCEYRNKFSFICKWVRPDKIDGCYLPENSGKKAVWNWCPDE